MARREKNFLAGFSGSGKSSLLQQLAATGPKSWKYLDLDQEILAAHPSFTQLAQLIEQYGWEKFRLLERQGIERFLKDPAPGVMSLGGGAFNSLLWQTYGHHPKIMFCYLYSSFEDCWQRLALDTDQPRPLALAGKEELRSLYQARLATYQLIPWKLNNSANASLEDLAQKFWDGLQ